MGPELGIPEHGAVECETGHGKMKSAQLVPVVGCVPSHNLALFTYRALENHLVCVLRDFWNRPCGKPPDLAEVVEEVEGVDALLVGEVEDAVEAVVVDDVEGGVDLVGAEVRGGGIDVVAASDIAVQDGGAAEGGGGFRGGVAGLDDDPEEG
jgi:hypothetical protein